MTRQRRVYLVFLAVFAASRVLFHAAGLHFTARHLDTMMHFVGVDLLRDRLLETLLYLHSQPPLMSVVTGLVLKTCGPHHVLALQALFLAAGVLIGWTLMALLLRLGFSAAIALAAAVGFSLLPGCVVYENYYFYTYPLLLLLLGCAYLFLVAVEGQRFGAWFACFGVAALVVNFKSMFHLVWLVLLGGFALRLSGRRHARTIVLAFLVPLLLGAGWYAKNWVVFGRFEASSWMGFGLARKTYHRFPAEKRRRWIETGRLDPVAGVYIYSGVQEWAAVLGRPARTGIPLLDNEVKTSGCVNFHHAIYPLASRRARDQALKVIRAAPLLYLEDVWRAARLFFGPAVWWHAVREPYTQIQGYCDALDSILHGPFSVKYCCVCAFVVLFVLGLAVPKVAALAAGRRPSAADAAYLFMALNVLYVFTLGVVLDTGETNRYRLATDGLIVVCALLGVRQVRRAVCRRLVRPGRNAAASRS